MDYVYRHNIGVYTTWSNKYELTIFHKGCKQWLSPDGWLGDKLLFMAAEDANVPDGRFYVANGINKTLGQIIDEIKSGNAYDEYWTRRDADFVLGRETERGKSLEVAASWDEIPNTDGMIINTNTIELPDEILDLASRFQRETGACRLAFVVAKDAIHDGYQPTGVGILEWIQDNKEWFKEMCLSPWYHRAITWLKAEYGFVPCTEW